MFTFLCPVCGTYHKIEKEQPILRHCRNCDHLFMVENNSVRPFSEDDVDMSASYSYQSRMGIPVPLANGKKANCWIGGRFYNLPREISVQDLIYRAILGGCDPNIVTLSDLLETAFPQNGSSLDSMRLKDLIGSIAWPDVKAALGEPVE